MLAKKGLLLVKGQTISLRTWTSDNQMPSKLFRRTFGIFSWLSWANGESFVYWHFVQVYQRWKFWSFWPRFTFVGHFGYEYQWWKLCDLEFAFEQPLASRSATRKFAFAGDNLWNPAVQTGAPTPGGNNVGMWLKVRIYIRTPVRTFACNLL